MYVLSWAFYIVLALTTMLMVKRCFIGNNINCILGNKKLFSINISIIVLYLMLLLFAVMRKIEHGIGGTDAYGYLQKLDNFTSSFSTYLHSIQSKPLFSIEEPLFKLFLIWCNQFHDSHAVFLFVVYGSIIFNLLYFIKRVYCKGLNFFPIILSICVYLSSFNIIRSWWSASICLLSFCFILDKKYFKSLFLIIVASLTHYMGFCFLGVWGCCLLYDRMPNLFNRKNLFIVGIGVNFFLIVFQAFIKSFVADTKYSFYADLYGYVTILGYIPTMLICAYSIWNFNYYKSSDSKTAKCVIAMTVNLSLMYAITALLAWRINDYFAMIRMYMISNFFCILKGKKNEKIYTCVLYLFTIVIFMQQMISLKEMSGIFPYVLFFM